MSNQPRVSASNKPIVGPNNMPVVGCGTGGCVPLILCATVKGGTVTYTEDGTSITITWPDSPFLCTNQHTIGTPRYFKGIYGSGHDYNLSDYYWQTPTYGTFPTLPASPGCMWIHNVHYAYELGAFQFMAAASWNDGEAHSRCVPVAVNILRDPATGNCWLTAYTWKVLNPQNAYRALSPIDDYFQWAIANPVVLVSETKAGPSTSAIGTYSGGSEVYVCPPGCPADPCTGGTPGDDAPDGWIYHWTSDPDCDNDQWALSLWTLEPMPDPAPAGGWISDTPFGNACAISFWTTSGTVPTPPATAGTPFPEGCCEPPAAPCECPSSLLEEYSVHIPAGTYGDMSWDEQTIAVTGTPCGWSSAEGAFAYDDNGTPNTSTVSLLLVTSEPCHWEVGVGPLPIGAKTTGLDPTGTYDNGWGVS